MTNWRTTIQDMLETSPLRGLVFTRHRWILPVLAGVLIIAASIGGGWMIAEISLLATLGAILGFAGLMWIFYDIEIAFIGVIGLITLLPFASLPFSIGFTPTFLDLALGVLFFAWMVPYLLGEEKTFIITPVGGAVLAFALMAVGSFVAGLPNGELTSYLLRHFAEIMLSIALFFLIVNSVRDSQRLGRIMRWLILGTTAAALLGIVLYLLPDLLSIRILSSLARLGYPAGAGVLRYIRDDPTLMQRATSTSVDPNILGSLLNLVMAMTLPQLFAKRRLLPTWILIPCLGIMGICLGLTVSRGSMVGMAGAVLVISVLRYRKLLPWIALALILVLMLPWTQSYVLHFIEGLQFQDLSMQMRLGEYKDTLTLIQRYPFLGVGFAGAPDLDIYVAVANVYMLIAAQMGLIGLAIFLAIMGITLQRFLAQRKIVRTMPDLEPLWYGLHAAIIGGLLGGLSDHYFFSLDFHHSVTLFWLIVGLTAAAAELVARAKHTQTSNATAPNPDARHAQLKTERV